MGVAHGPPLAVQVDLDTPAAGGGAAHQTHRTCNADQSTRLRSKPASAGAGPGRALGRTLVAVAVGPADGSRVLPEEAPGVGLPVWVPAVAVLPQPSARVLHDVVRKLRPLQTGGARVRLGHGPVVVPQFCESLRAGQRRCAERGGDLSRCVGQWEGQQEVFG